MAELLFVYGTLHPERAPREIADAVKRLVSGARATVRGRLRDFGEYPGLMLDDAGDTIAGELFVVPDEGTFAALDAYEDFRPQDPASSLFLRVRTTAALEDGSQRECWVYVWNGTREASEPEEYVWDSRRGDCCAGES